MAVKYNRHREYQQTVDKAWQWMRTHRAYHHDYSQSKRIGRTVFKDLWGFWPPVDPNEKHAPTRLYLYLKKYLGIKNFAPLYPKNISKIALDFRDDKVISKFEKLPKEPPKALIVHVDYTAPIAILVHELKKLVSDFRNAYKLKEKRVRINDIADLYKIEVCLKLGGRGERLANWVYPGIDVDDGIARVQRRRKAIKIASK